MVWKSDNLICAWFLPVNSLKVFTRIGWGLQSSRVWQLADQNETSKKSKPWSMVHGSLSNYRYKRRFEIQPDSARLKHQVFEKIGRLAHVGKWSQKSTCTQTHTHTTVPCRPLTIQFFPLMWALGFIQCHWPIQPSVQVSMKRLVRKTIYSQVWPIPLRHVWNALLMASSSSSSDSVSTRQNAKVVNNVVIAQVIVNLNSNCQAKSCQATHIYTHTHAQDLNNHTEVSTCTCKEQYWNWNYYGYD